MVEHIFIQHCKKLEKRKEYIDSIISNHSFFKERTTLITFDESDDEHNFENSNYIYNELWPQGLKRTEIFIAEQMFFIYEQIKNKQYKSVLILEDDFILNENFNLLHEKIFNDLPENFDCVFLSSCGELLVPSNFEGLFWESSTSRCTCGYVVSKNFCEKITVNKKYFSPIDWHLNFVKKELDLRYYWSKPILINQGSEYQYNSNIR